MLNILSWNLPKRLSHGLDDTIENVTVNRLKCIYEKNPDLLVLQEWDIDIQIENYELLSNVRSHVGYICIYKHVNFHITDIDIQIFGKYAIHLRFKLHGDQYSLVGCHLSPLPAGRKSRETERKFIASTVNPSDKIIVIGDLNNRKSEDVVFRYTDVNLPHTWGKGNPYNGEQMKHMMYFDKCYLSNLHAYTSTLIGNEVYKDGHYLSDHFGIYVEVGIAYPKCLIK